MSNTKVRKYCLKQFNMFKIQNDELSKKLVRNIN